MDKSIPKISVVMPVYNSEKYLYEALESIRLQTFKDFECLIINDGSTDSSKKIIKEFVEKDIRFILIDKKNEGVGIALNLGVKTAKANLIARMDSDDISYPKRLEIQYKYFQKNNSITVLGSAVKLIDERGNKIKGFRLSLPISNLQCKWIQLRSGIPFSHPSVMFKKSEILDIGSYTSELAEDFILWLKLYEKEFSNINKKLVKYRLHSNQTSSNYTTKNLVYNQIVSNLKVLYQSYGMLFDEEISKFLYNYKLISYPLDFNNQVRFYRYLFDLQKTFMTKFAVKKLNDKLFIKWSSIKQGFKVLKISQKRRLFNFLLFVLRINFD